VAKHGFVLFAKPLLTPTIPNAWPLGSVLLHCGHEISFPSAVTGAAFLAASTVEPLKIIIEIDANDENVLNKSLFISIKYSKHLV
jgi:hypothetical protein